MRSNQESSIVAPNTGTQSRRVGCRSAIKGTFTIDVATAKDPCLETKYQEAQECSRIGAACFAAGLPPCWH